MSNTDNQAKIAEARRKLLEKRLKSKNGKQEQAATISKKPSDAPAYASLGQQRLWYIQQMRPDSIAYHMTNLTRISGHVNIAALQKSLQSISDHQSILRTGFVLDNGIILQNIEAAITIELKQITSDSDSAIDKIQNFAEIPFNLAQAPLWRAMLVTVSENEHYFALILHHIISDEWSLDVLWQNLATCYDAYCNDKTPDLAELDIQYVDYAHWQNEQIANNHYDQQRTYWRNQLAGDLPLLQLPTDRPRPAIQQFQGELRDLQLDSDLTAKLQKISKDAGTTLFTTLIAAYQILLHRYTSQDDILVGIPIANRSQTQTEKLIGFFLNTLVLRADFSDERSFSEHLALVAKQSLDALKQQDLPFDVLVNDLNPKRDPSYNPIFQTMFVYQDAAAHQPTLPNLKLEPIQLDAGVAKFDMTLFARLDDEKLLLGLEFDTALFDGTTAEKFLQHYRLLLEGIVAAPQKNIAKIDILSNNERQQLTQWNQTQADYPHDKLIHDLIISQPKNAIAIKSENADLSYGDLLLRANYLAQTLVDKGIVPNTAIGLCAERSADLFVGILGILLAGAAYVPIDPAYPDERISYILDDANIDILVTQSHLQDKFEATTLILSDDTLAEPPKIDATPDTLAYMIYTSGSTGKPKGVRVTHRNLVHSTTARFAVYDNPVERFLLLSSFAFDSSLVGIFWTLCSGGTLCLPPHDGEKDIQLIARLIADYKITHMLALPSLYQILLEFSDKTQLTSLNTVIVAGEASPLRLVDAHYDLLPNARLYNEYGPTEGTVWATVWEIPKNAEKILIGKPIPNMQAEIVDTYLQPVPIGIVGELIIAGEGITQGYHNRPQLTQERFIDNGNRYKTGDLARFLPDGTIEFLGRVDHQVKISGYRIELGEIESALLQQRGVQEAIVLAIEGQSQTSDAIPLDDMLAQMKTTKALALLDEIENLSDSDAEHILNTLLGEN